MPTELVSVESSSWFTGSHHLAECSSDLISVLIREARREREREGKKDSYSDVSPYKDTNPVGSGPHPYDLI